MQKGSLYIYALAIKGECMETKDAMLGYGFPVAEVNLAYSFGKFKKVNVSPEVLIELFIIYIIECSFKKILKGYVYILRNPLDYDPFMTLFYHLSRYVMPQIIVN
ncbi:hypothetical protein RND81_14G173900 [Saponaria officinalis]|uniref:Uncharacterized protein n=1 Tax=Saponaria officinalis TaxID=3572 RepID=A0AAW1GRB9_SAPOF